MFTGDISGYHSDVAVDLSFLGLTSLSQMLGSHQLLEVL